MAETGREPTGSMGNDTPHAVLSKKPQLLYNYFKQLFAQVTNPAIDPIREELVMSLMTFIGPERNILEESPSHCRRLWIEEPILTDSGLKKIRNTNSGRFKTKTISLLFKKDNVNDFLKRLDEICREAEDAIKEKYTFIDRKSTRLNSSHTDISRMPSSA